MKRIMKHTTSLLASVSVATGLKAQPEILKTRLHKEFKAALIHVLSNKFAGLVRNY